MYVRKKKWRVSCKIKKNSRLCDKPKKENLTFPNKLLINHKYIRYNYKIVKIKVYNRK